VDYLGLSKEGRETRTLVEIYPEYFLVQPAPSGGEGAYVTLRDDAPHIGEDEEDASMAGIRKAVDAQEAEELAARRPAAESDEEMFGGPVLPSPAAALPAAGPGNLDVFPEVVRRDLRGSPYRGPSLAALVRGVDRRARDPPRADGAPKRRPRPRGG
jgi:hypothetical protein